MRPAVPDRDFWHRTLAVALDDLAGLVAPGVVVLCEGKGPSDGFDSDCYRTIFRSDFPDAEFLSVGNAHDVISDKRGMFGAIQIVAPGSTVLRLVDRDERSDDEIAKLADSGVRCLTRRNIESYLLADEVLTRLCVSSGVGDRATELLTEKTRLLDASIARGNPADDLKSIGGELQVFCRRNLGLTQSGSTAEEFLRSTLSPLVRQSPETYADLRAAVFGN